MPCTRGTTAVSGMVVSLLFILVWLCKGAESGVRPGLSIDTTCLQRLDWGVSIVCRTRWKSAGNRLVDHGWSVAAARDPQPRLSNNRAPALQVL